MLIQTYDETYFYEIYTSLLEVQLLKNKIILISGYCATGKSTFSHNLANRYKLPCFNKDTLKEVIGEGFGAENTDVHKKNSTVTFSLMLHIAEKFLQTGQICILESNFKKSESVHIESLLAKYDCECLTFLFKGDLDAIYDRYKERDRLGERHWVHSSAGENREGFIQGHLYAGLGDVAIGQTITVDATVFEDVDDAKLFNIAENFLTSQ